MWQNPHFRLKLVDEPITLEFDPNYYYNVKHVGTDVIAENGVSVSIEERYRKTTTSGGSCFYVFSETASSTIRQMCSFWDFFNGTYVVWCPAMGGEPCMDISILLQYTNFTAYTSSRHPMHHVQIGFQLIVVTSPPVADDHEQYRRGSRNCCALSAFVYELHARLISTGVDIFDEFSVILPWQRRAACTGHYMCFNIRRNEPLTVKGEVGELALLLLMDRVCRQTR
ncbi:hypothetical protein NP493_2237g00004 [Ridgeia piscesae]|uniref:Uncharacterized protein n=1 Tax=Ridgeia piscesae TaxID=27915 RepID=A0AAD9JJS5_RIDPI|nr:hypothetical protein NP493_2237g00004 [Ridgeia piscesae]